MKQLPVVRATVLAAAFLAGISLKSGNIANACGMNMPKGLGGVK